MSIQALRILPPIAIARLGSAADPLVAYEIASDPEHPLDICRIRGAKTLVVDRNSGEILDAFVPEVVSFKEACTEDGEPGERIRPVAPFLEVWARLADDRWVPLTLDLLAENGLTPADLSWQATVANRKVARRTADENDQVTAATPPSRRTRPSRSTDIAPTSWMRTPLSTSARCSDIRPTAQYPEIRLRFTPAKGKIYGPRLDPEQLAGTYGTDWRETVWIPPPEQAVYDPAKGWFKFETDKASGASGISRSGNGDEQE
ncbi:MAG: hypothetical protein HC900_06140, partial [Methylacidiphilales bacterium]|nr:hypothetical protein [Candidatus Methylacidiphilales bacterium]